MIRPPFILTAALSALLLTSCAQVAVPVPTSQITPTATSIPHAPQIRFALIGEVTDPNVWALFDVQGQSYNNYAVESDYWPRLYGLSVPERQFQPQAAIGMPSIVQQEGGFYTATVPLRTDLKWDDGTPFTADDVVFTVSTVLSFQLGFDWLSFYDPVSLDHAAAMDAHTVKFYFKTAPNVLIWQYGALQGPIVQKSYWSPRIAAPIALLPPSDLSTQIDYLKSKIASLQAATNGSSTTSSNDEESRLAQGDLDQAINDLAKAHLSYDSAMNAARQSLYALTDGGEPQLGTWRFDNIKNGVIENTANPNFYFDHPNFDHAVYRIYPTEDAALAALKDGDVDVVLAPDGIEPMASASLADPIKIDGNPTYSLRFLAFNESTPVLSKSAIRQALACVIDSDVLGRELNGQVIPLASFVLPGEMYWYNADAVLPCKGLDETARFSQAVQLLDSAGYTWDKKPAGNVAGQGLKTPAGDAFPPLELLTPSTDPLRAATASYVQGQARLLGIPLTAQRVPPDEINYAVFSSHKFDAAILGWRVSPYPGYLCEWFGDGRPFNYGGSDLTSQCDALAGTSNLQAARQLIFRIQSLLDQDLPFIPLYSGITQDVYRNVTYPFGQVLGGLNGLYGAPSLVIPAP